MWSPDGNEVLFAIGPGGKNPAGIYRKSSSGTGAEELLVQPKEADAWLWPTDWSSSGQFILCVQGNIVSQDGREIWVVPASGDRKPRVFVRAPGSAYDGQFSPDGHWVAYVSKESGREEVYVVPFDGNQALSTAPLEQVAIKKRWQVSTNGGAFPRWSHDGKELFYVAPGDEFTGVRVEAKGNEISVSEARSLFKESLASVTIPYDVSGGPALFSEWVRGKRHVAAHLSIELEGIVEGQIKQTVDRTPLRFASVSRFRASSLHFGAIFLGFVLIDDAQFPRIDVHLDRGMRARLWRTAVNRSAHFVLMP